ncbi:MAG TPA: hypothetical protein VEY67_07065 [Candidatus Dormibacteraeota bacterium]|nr:hypothetical protein [Candidatus Dormibacteraeota bacterium]
MPPIDLRSRGHVPLATWTEDPDAAEPVVLILGGFLTSPPLYVALARRLRRRGAAEVLIGRAWTPDWVLAASRGLGPLVTRAGRGLVRAGERAATSPRARGAPVLVVGHSAGGLLGRLLTSPVPYAGRQLGAAARIGALVTLGTPHHLSASADLGGRLAPLASAFTDAVIPGAAFAPHVGYVTVASRSIRGAPDGDQREQTAHRFYRGLLGDELSVAEGDGLIPVASALLDGATRIVLPNAVHGQFGGGPWYGSDEIVDAWWPAALDAWHGALRARVEATDKGPGHAEGPDRALRGTSSGLHLTEGRPVG